LAVSSFTFTVEDLALIRQSELGAHPILIPSLHT
jgi:hypothetical protein